MKVPVPCLVVLVGPAGAGKSAWATENFRPEEIVSSDAIRALVGEGPDDQRAGKDAFDVLDLVLERRLRRGLVTVIDTLGLDGPRRRGYIALARGHGVPCFAVAFDTPVEECRRRNRTRARRVPENVLSAQFRSWEAVREMLPGEGFDAVLAPGELWESLAGRARGQRDERG